MTTHNDLIQQYLAKKSCPSDTGCGTSAFMNYDAHPNLRQDQVYEAFFDRFIDQSQFLRDINTFRTQHCSGVIPRLDSCSIVTTGKCAASCNSSNLDIVESYLTYDLKQYKTCLEVGYDFLDCNKMGSPEFVNQYLQDLMMKTHANNMARTALMGDEDLATGPNETDLNNLLGVNDGFLKLFCSCTPEPQILDAQGMGPSRELYMAARKLLPPQFRGMRREMQFMGGMSQTDWLALDTSYRPTVKGDEACETGEVGRLWGNTFYELPEWPEDLPYGDKQVGHLVLTTLDNLNYVQRNEPRISTEYDQDCDSWKTIMRTEADFMVSDERKVVLIKNIDWCGEPWNGCVMPGKDNCSYQFENPCCPAE